MSILDQTAADDPRTLRQALRDWFFFWTWDRHDKMVLAILGMLAAVIMTAIFARGLKDELRHERQRATALEQRLKSCGCR